MRDRRCHKTWGNTRVLSHETRLERASSPVTLREREAAVESGREERGVSRLERGEEREERDHSLSPSEAPTDTTSCARAHHVSMSACHHQMMESTAWYQREHSIGNWYQREQSNGN